MIFAPQYQYTRERYYYCCLQRAVVQHSVSFRHQECIHGTVRTPQKRRRKQKKYVQIHRRNVAASLPIFRSARHEAQYHGWAGLTLTTCIVPGTDACPYHKTSWYRFSSCNDNAIVLDTWYVCITRTRTVGTGISMTQSYRPSCWCCYYCCCWYFAISSAAQRYTIQPNEKLLCVVYTTLLVNPSSTRTPCPSPIICRCSCLPTICSE